MSDARTKCSLVIHVPHASTVIPSGVRRQFLLDDEALAAEATESADLWTGLLARDVWPDAVRVEARVARIVVDVERYADDDRGAADAAGGEDGRLT